MFKLIALSNTAMLNVYSQWLETSVELISVMLAFNDKKDAIK